MLWEASGVRKIDFLNLGVHVLGEKGSTTNEIEPPLVCSPAYQIR